MAVHVSDLAQLHGVTLTKQDTETLDLPLAGGPRRIAVTWSR